MDIDKLEAGRELDALVAEKVMEWKRSKHTDGALYRITYFDATNDVHYVLEANYDCYMWALPPFSTDIVAAMTVVKEMDTKGFYCRMLTPFWAGQLYFAGFTPHGTTGWNQRPDYEEGADTLQVAICRAALKAVAG